jgi:hypothetical protein
VNFSDFDIIKKIKKSTTAVRTCEKELAKKEKLSAENQLLAERLGLDKNAESQALRVSNEATINSMRTKLAEMKVAHNTFVQEHGYPSELLLE